MIPPKKKNKVSLKPSHSPVSAGSSKRRTRPTDPSVIAKVDDRKSSSDIPLELKSGNSLGSATSNTLTLPMYSEQSEKEAVMRALERLSRQPRRRSKAVSLFKLPPKYASWFAYLNAEVLR